VRWCWPNTFDLTPPDTLCLTVLRQRRPSSWCSYVLDSYLISCVVLCTSCAMADVGIYSPAKYCLCTVMYFLCIYWKITGRSQAVWARVLSCFICCHVATCNIAINCMRGPEECWDPGGTCCLLAWSMRQVFARFNFHQLSSGLFQLRFVFEKPAAPGLSQRRLGRRATPKYGACTKLLFDTPLRPHEQRDRRLQQQR
jgi:hypothetical protein